MKIAVDCRYFGRSGIGRVNEGILDELDFSAHEYTLIGEREKLKKYEGKAKIVENSDDPYSIRGILKINREVNECDLFYAPNFLIPYSVRVPVVATMHDLIFLDKKETTRGAIDRLIKKKLLKRCMKRAKKIACVSEFTRERCEAYYKKLAKKCFVAHNGIGKNVLKADVSSVQKQKGLLVFVGNVKPHKGLKTLIAAFQKLSKGEYTLKIIGEKDSFLTGENSADLTCEGVVFTGRLTDDQGLFDEIARAEFLIQPSKYEGFGLPPLEALCLGTRPIVSDIPVFREIYGEFDVTYFKEGDADDLAAKILSAPVRTSTTAEDVSKKYDYKRAAELIENSFAEAIKR